MNPKTSDISFAPFINFRRLQAMTFWTYFLSIADGILTIFWTKSNLATEANPLMDQLLIYAAVIMTLWSGVDYFIRNGSVLLQNGDAA